MLILSPEYSFIMGHLTFPLRESPPCLIIVLKLKGVGRDGFKGGPNTQMFMTDLVKFSF